ncbi:MAG: hypothetical protein FWC68_00710 [Oscillospiraceae bacterium]|nr:hypothetical protein [Oscillospiraceae bacterium]
MPSKAAKKRLEQAVLEQQENTRTGQARKALAPKVNDEQVKISIPLIAKINGLVRSDSYESKREPIDIDTGLKYLQPLIAETAKKIVEEREAQGEAPLEGNELVEETKIRLLLEYHEDVESDFEGVEETLEEVKQLIAVNQLKQISSRTLEHYFAHRDGEKQYSGHEDAKKLLYNYFKQTLASGKAREVKKGWAEYIRNIETESTDVVKRHLMRRISMLHSYGFIEGLLQSQKRYLSGDTSEKLRLQVGDEAGKYLEEAIADLGLNIEVEPSFESSGIEYPKEVRKKYGTNKYRNRNAFLLELGNPHMGELAELMKKGTQSEKFDEIGMLNILKECGGDYSSLILLVVEYEKLYLMCRQMMASAVQTIEGYNLWEDAIHCSWEEFEEKATPNKIGRIAYQIVFLRELLKSLNNIAEEKGEEDSSHAGGRKEREKRVIKRFNELFLKHIVGDHAIFKYGQSLLQCGLEDLQVSEVVEEMMSDSLGAPPIRARDKLLGSYGGSKEEIKTYVAMVKLLLGDLRFAIFSRGTGFHLLQEAGQEFNKIAIEATMQGLIHTEDWRNSR